MAQDLLPTTAEEFSTDAIDSQAAMLKRMSAAQSHAFIKQISYMSVLERQLKVMDMTAISLAMDNDLPLVVFNLSDAGSMRRVVCGEAVGSRIDNTVCPKASGERAAAAPGSGAGCGRCSRSCTWSQCSSSSVAIRRPSSPRTC